MEVVFSIEKNGKLIEKVNSYQVAFRNLCQYIQQENPQYEYIRKATSTIEEVKDYYVNDGLYLKKEKVFGFGSFIVTVGDNTYQITP